MGPRTKGARSRLSALQPLAIRPALSTDIRFSIRQKHPRLSGHSSRIRLDLNWKPREPGFWEKDYFPRYESEERVLIQQLSYIKRTALAPSTASFTFTVTLSVSQFNFGFDQQGFAATQAMDAFDRQFGKYNSKKGTYELPTVWLSLFNGLNYIGFGGGIIIGSFVSKHFGRRMCMFTMSCWAIVAATIIITSKNRDQILAARVLNYIYIGMELSVVPIFQSEITPQKARGFVVGTYQISLVVSLVINSVARGTGSMENNAAWRIPFGLFYIIPSCVAACIWFVPESPRWLIMKDRPEQAMQTLRKLRRGKFSDDEIAAEFQMILAGINQEHEKGTFVDMFRGVNLKRTFIVLGCNFFLQSTGSIFVSVYGAIFVKSLGTINPFTITCTTAAVNFWVGILAMALVDKLGRRIMLLIGASIQCAALMIMGALGTVHNPGHDIKSGIIAMMIIFASGYSLGWAPIVHTLSAELPSSKLRDMTYRTASVLNICTQFAVSFSIPYLLNAPYANLGSKVGFIFGSMALISIVFAFFCVPECRGRSLEEIDLLFESGTRMRDFVTAKVDLQADARENLELKAGVVAHVEQSVVPKI
ncbi:uncharacterized protein Z518_04936 [Rhinocladiella mackenziei CBS 650.93]|uniref:Major facilitator superfamily (MFS) profile domain-containing protein n=1 Tax=Rhinocladiella mackenziei CBS 650.93 TaxID=1442369 RepID=A0A0D2JCW0_9EURO|nr:uncharacterized protein Z518_04936 [Rhinocladiella mackenziei CBS 650.93]KIX06960.1 hypothetical protein Z518_04936 [Rhinocladiella mackenziei CBS 650.93]